MLASPDMDTGLTGAPLRALVVYGTTHGHTARIAERIASRLRGRGAVVTSLELPALGVPPIDPADYDAIVIGGRVHGGRYPWRVLRFVRRHGAALRARTSAFFSVSLLQLGNDAAARERTELLPARTWPRRGWTPDVVAVIAGALAWPRYGRFGAGLEEAIWSRAMPLPAPVDRSSVQEFTDWTQVDRFADDVASLAERRRRVGCASAQAVRGARREIRAREGGSPLAARRA